MDDLTTFTQTGLSKGDPALLPTMHSTHCPYEPSSKHIALVFLPLQASHLTVPVTHLGSHNTERLYIIAVSGIIQLGFKSVIQIPAQGLKCVILSKYEEIPCKMGLPWWLRD